MSSCWMRGGYVQQQDDGPKVQKKNQGQDMISYIKRKKKLNSEDLEGSVVADGDPVGLRCSPLNLINLSLGGRVGQDRILNGPRHLLNVPNEGLMIVAGRANVTRRVRSPGDAVDARPVIAETGHGSARDPHVQNHHLARVHGDGGQIGRILSVPGQSQQRPVLRIFVDDGRVLQVAQVKHSDRAVGAHRGEHIPTATCPAEGNVVNFLVVGDELSLDVSRDASRWLAHSPHHLPRLQTPNGARRVDARCANEIGFNFVPVETCERSAKVRVLVLS